MCLSFNWYFIDKNKLLFFSSAYFLCFISDKWFIDAYFYEQITLKMFYSSIAFHFFFTELKISFSFRLRPVSLIANGLEDTMTEGWPHSARFISKKLCHLEKGPWNLLIKQKSLLAVICSRGKKILLLCHKRIGRDLLLFLSVLTSGQVCINGICQVHTYLGTF